jgi:protein SCO1
MSTDLQQPTWIADLHTPRWLGLLLVALPLVAIIAFLGYQSTQVLPRISLAPSYSLINQNGERLTSEMLRGSLVIYNVTHTRCTAPCIDSSLTLQQLQQTLADVEMGDIPLHFVTISSDPLFDTPEILYGYANTLEADTETWHFVSGKPEQIRNLLQSGFQNETISSTGEPFIALVDGWGIVRAIYPAATPDLALLKHDLRLVAQEANKSTGVNRYAYEAVHLFMCHNDLYPQQP